MKLPRIQIATAVADEISHQAFGKREITSLAAYLLEEGRTGDLDSLLRDVQAIRTKQGHVEVVSTSAHELSEEDNRDIVSTVRALYPEAKQIVVTPQLDPSLVGGIRLQFDGYELDVSVAGKLRQFKALAVYGKE